MKRGNRPPKMGITPNKIGIDSFSNEYKDLVDTFAGIGNNSNLGEETLISLAEDWINDFTEKSTGATFAWTDNVAREFRNVPIETLIRDPYFLGMEDKVYDGVMEDILDLFEERKHRDIHLAVFLEGIGAGKTTKSSILMWLVWYMLSLEPDPQKYYDLAPRSVIALMMMSRCLTGDTLINTKTGLKYINTIKTKEKISSLIRDNLVTKTVNNGIKQTQIIKVQTGQVIKGTLNHRLLKFNKVNFKDTEIKDLKIGDLLVTKYGQCNFGNNLDFSPEIAYVLGVLTGDGYYGGAREKIDFTMHKDDSEVGNYIKEIIESKYGGTIKAYPVPGANTIRWLFQGEAFQGFKALLKQHDLQRLGDKKYVPQAILEAPQAIQTEFLRGLFDTDGSACKTRPKIQVTSISHQLIYEVQAILLNMGIFCYIKPKKARALTLYIEGTEAIKFRETIGFRLKRKNEILWSYNSSKTQGISIYGVNKLINEVYTKSKKPRTTLKFWQLTKVRKNYVRLNKLKEFVDYFNDNLDLESYQFLRWIVNDNIYLNKIVSKNAGESEEVYDLTIDREPYFNANSLISHNSEQQARRVTFTEVWNRFQSPFNKDYFPPHERLSREIRIATNNTCVYAGTSSALSSLGYNLFGALIDEASFLEVVEESKKEDGLLDQAESMYNAIYNRMLSRFLKAGKLPGLIAMISSPRFPNDFLHRKIEEAKRDPNSGIFWRRRSTWEAKGVKHYPQNDAFFIDTENSEVIDDPHLIKLLQDIPKNFYPLDLSLDELSKIAKGYKP